MDQREQIGQMIPNEIHTMGGAINAEAMTVEELHQKLEAGYQDVKNGRVQNAKKAFTEFRMKSR